MKSRIISLFRKFEKVFTYLFFSILSTIVDVTVVWIAFHVAGIELAVANTMGVVSGFFIGYFLSLKRVFNTGQSLGAFAVYVGTSCIGLVLANYLITTAYDFSIRYCPDWFAFLFSKGVSVVFPFFVMYLMRKYIYMWLNKRSHHS